MHFCKEKLPYNMSGQWSQRSDFWILNSLNFVLWLMRLVSPSAWIMPFLQQKDKDKYYTHPIATEIYQLVVLIIPITVFLFFTNVLKESIVTLFLLTCLGIESIQYQLRSVLLRPFFQPSFKLYSAARTLVIIFVQYIQIIFIYASVYILFFSCDFNIANFSQKASLEFSIITITTVGFGSIYPNPGSTASLIASTEGLIGVFMLGVIISTTMSRTRSVGEIGQKKEISNSKIFDLKSSINISSWKELLFLSSVLEHDLWVTGGWIRNLYLGFNNYIGDIDCLSEKSIDEIELLFHKNNVAHHKTSKNGIIVYLNCGNHIDIISCESLAESASDNKLIDALQNFNFSVNAAAVNIATSEVVRTKDFLQDINSKRFRCTFSEKNLDSEQLDRKIIKDFLVLQKHYQLSVVDDKKSRAVSNELQKLENDFSAMDLEKLCKISRKLLKGLDDTCEIWLVRGAVRSSVLKEFKFWDDLDVVVDTSKKNLISYLDSNEVPYTINHFGNPKVRFSSGVIMDIWALPKNRTLTAHLEEFTFLNDSIAVNVMSHEVVELKNSIKYTENRILSTNLTWLSSASDTDKAYASLKALYLILRHNLKPTETVLELISNNYPVTLLLRINSIKLAKELAIIYETQDLLEKIKIITEFIEVGECAALLTREISNKSILPTDKAAAD